jgi:replicative DNA helicase
MTGSQRNGARQARSNGDGGNGSGRVPPHNLQAEESLLGAMLLDRNAILAAAEAGLTPDEFYRPAHAHIFEAMRSLYGRGEPADPVTVSDELRRTNLLDAVGGPATLIAIQGGTPATSHAGRYAGIVADHAILRRLIAVGNEVAELGYSAPTDVDAAIDAAETIVFAVADRNRPCRTIRMGDDLAGWSERVRARADSAVPGISTGYTDLDRELLGLRPGGLILVAGRTGMGKSAFLGGVATHAAAEGHPVLVVSLEMSLEQLEDRYIAAEARIDQTHIRSGRLSENEWAELSASVKRFEEMPLYVSDAPGATLLSVRADAMRVAQKAGRLGLLIVDYTQLLKSVGRSENRQVEVSALASGLKHLAGELHVPVVAAAQLSRALELRADKRPVLADLRESGDLENNAEVCLFLYRDEYYNPDSKDRGICEVIIGKNRYGPFPKTITLTWIAKYGQFANTSRTLRAL